MSQPASEEAIFLSALEKGTPTERAAYLEAACGADADLRRCVERLLEAHPHVGAFLESPAAVEERTQDPQGANAPGASSPTAGPGTRIGPYKVLQQIGEGGMGVVWMAEQEEPVRRQVALKIIKPGMDSQQIIARFEAERQALALMDHPNIAKSLLGGALLGQKQYAAAEPLLKEGYEGLKQRAAKIPPANKVRLIEALERLVRLFVATGKNDEAAKWRTELEAAAAREKP
jgi:hypothetical protein